MKTIDQLSKLYSQGKVSRRTFMQGATALGLTISAASGLAVRAEAATPKMGGTLRIGQGHGSTTDSLDPATFENGYTAVMGYAIANHLTEVGPDGQLRPELAESIEASDDAATWRFKLRKGVTFHNGKSLTTEDVIDSFNHHRGEKSKSAAKGLLAAVKSIKADGDTVVFVLKDGNADFPFIASDYHFAIRPSNGDGTIDWASGIGTGGYVLNSFDPGVRSEYTRYPNYWKENAAFVENVHQLSIIDVTARQNALMNGEVDVIDRVDPKTVSLLARVPILDIVETTGTLHYTFPMRLDTKPFDNYDLRMALKLAVKRQELVDKILLGHGVLGNDHPISVANPYHDGDLPQREFDADKAAFHYKKSGHSGTIKLSASDAAFAGAVDAAQLIKASAGQVGIDIEVVREPNDGYWSEVWNKQPFCASYWGGRPVQDQMYSVAYSSTADWNDTQYNDPHFDELLLSARGELDQAKRKAIYREMGMIVRDEGGLICPMFNDFIDAASDKVGGYVKDPNGAMMNGFALEKAWLM